MNFVFVGGTSNFSLWHIAPNEWEGVYVCVWILVA